MAYMKSLVNKLAEKFIREAFPSLGSGSNGTVNRLKAFSQKIKSFPEK